MKAKTFLFAFLTWFIPIAVSMLMYDYQTNAYVPNFITFKVVMLVLLFGLTYYFYRIIKKHQHLNWLKTAIIFTVTCSVLDFAFLLTVFKVSLPVWSMAIFPFYLLSFFGLGFLMLRKRIKVQA
jgi:hypothetical protein